jgi:tetratricopeptide (TPR) repeat protein
MEFLAQQDAPLKGSNQRAALTQIAGEIENVRVAWQWAAEHGRADLIMRAAEALWFFYVERNYFREGEEVFGNVALLLERIENIPDAEREFALGKVLMHQGTYYIRLGAYEQVRKLEQRSITLLRRLNAQREVGLALNFLAAATHLLGSYDEEQQLLQESITLAQAAGDRWLAAYSLNDLGMVTYVLGDPAKAQQLSRESLAIFHAIDDQRGMAFALDNLGAVAQHLGNYKEAERLYRESLALRRANGDQWGVATMLTRLGAVARTTGDEETARSYFLEALQIARNARLLPALLDALVELAALLVSQGESDQAGAILRSSLQHSTLSKHTRQTAERLLAELSAYTGHQDAALAHERMPARSVEALVTALLHEQLVKG